MGSCCAKPPTDHSFIQVLDPEEWTQQQICTWLQYSCDGELSDLITIFSNQKISGLSFIKLSCDDLKSFGINQIGLREQFVHERDKVMANYENKCAVTTIATQIKTQTQKHIHKHVVMNSQTFNSSDIRHVTTPTVDVNDEQIGLINEEESEISEPVSQTSSILATTPSNASKRASILSNNIPVSKIQTFAPQTTTISVISEKKLEKIITAKSSETYWISMDYDEIIKVFGMYNIEMKRNGYNIYDLNELQQYCKYSYIIYSETVVDSFIRLNEIMLNKHYGKKYNNSVILIPSVINKICKRYYFDHEIAIVQFAYEIYLILDQIEKSRYINSQWIPSFNGNILVSCIKDKYKYKSTAFIQRYCTNLLQYEYIELFAKVDDDEIFGDTRLVLSSLLHPILDTTHELSNRNNIISGDNLFKFNKNMRLLFEKYKYFIQYKLDRNAWRIGTKIKIYSSSFGEWKFGEIYQIEKDGYIIVTYGDCNNKFKKKIRIDADTIKSTNKFKSNRNKWDIGSYIQIFDEDNVWYRGKITEKRYYTGYLQDAFIVSYFKNNNNIKEFKKLVYRWSDEIRDIPIIICKKLKKYESGTKIKIYSNTKKCWLIGMVKNVISDSEMINIVYGEKNEWEKTVHINSNQIEWINQ